MRNEFNLKQAEYVNSTTEIEFIFDQFQKQYIPDISDEQYIDYFYRIVYFFDHANSTKLSPENNDDLYNEQYGETNTEHKNLLTVPKNINKYIDFQKGNFVPVCKFVKENPKRAFDNEIVVSIDHERNLVWANVTTIKHIYKMRNSKEPLKSYCYCVSNYCIPSTTELLRGKADDILTGKSTELTTLDFSEDSKKIEEAISQSVLHVGRMDIDVDHKNIYHTENGECVFSNDEMSILNKYFGTLAGPPHFHFVYKDYILTMNSHDSSALAINVDGLTSYLVDLVFTNLNSEDNILKFDFGMPFNDIKKAESTISTQYAKNMLAGLANIYNSLDENAKENFINMLVLDLREKVKSNEKMNKPNLTKNVENFSSDLERLIQILKNQEIDENLELGSLNLLAFESSAISQIYKLSSGNKDLEYEVAKVGNDFYNTIEHCLSKISKEAPTSNKQNDLLSENAGELN